MKSIYEDDVEVGKLTRKAFEHTESRLLQIHRFGDTDEEHVAMLLKVFNPPRGITIADVGCGVGRLAQLMKHKRPDLYFFLVNKSREQLAMCPPEFEAVYGTAESLPLGIVTCDAIMVTYVLGHIDLSKFISECWRVHTKEVYVYDLFKLFDTEDCRLKRDLDYTQRTIQETVGYFELAGFKRRNTLGYGYTNKTPNEISELMPHPETLVNTISAALVFER